MRQEENRPQQRTLRDIERGWHYGNLSALRDALQEAYAMGVESISKIVEGVASPVVETRREVVYTGEVFDCPAQSVVEESCICKPNWGHRSFHIRAALADTRVVPEGQQAPLREAAQPIEIYGPDGACLSCGVKEGNIHKGGCAYCKVTEESVLREAAPITPRESGWEVYAPEGGFNADKRRYENSYSICLDGGNASHKCIALVFGETDEEASETAAKIVAWSQESASVLREAAPITPRESGWEVYAPEGGFNADKRRYENSYSICLDGGNASHKCIALVFGETDEEASETAAKIVAWSQESASVLREAATPTNEKEFIPGTKLIERERERQIDKEGYDSRHDEEHDGGELADAAACYACGAASIVRGASVEELVEPMTNAFDSMLTWPWDAQEFKLKDDPIRDLVIAGALIAAEIDRLQRLADSSALSPSKEKE